MQGWTLAANFACLQSVTSNKCGGHDRRKIMRLDNISTILFFTSVIYWLYLLDPFKSKPQTRRYKKIVSDKTTRLINVFISLILMTVGLVRLYIYHKVIIGPLLPITFILTVIVLNNISQKLTARDFHLLLRWDTLKTSAYDKFASFFALLFPWLITFIIPLTLRH